MLLLAVATILGFIAGYILGTTSGSGAAQPIVPGTPAEVIVAIHAGLARRERVVAHARLRAPTAVALIVRDLNELPAIKQSTLLCPNDNGSFDVLQFRYRDGDRWTIVVKRSGCLLVYARADRGNTRNDPGRVFNVIGRLVHSPARGAEAELARGRGMQ